jgi:hypothetical protein
MSKIGRAEIAGEQMGKALLEFIHMMYQKNTAKRVVKSLIETLTKGAVW